MEKNPFENPEVGKETGPTETKKILSESAPEHFDPKHKEGPLDPGNVRNVREAEKRGKDPLTNLSNDKAFLEKLEPYLESERRERDGTGDKREQDKSPEKFKPTSLVFLDFDAMKQLNDQLGQDNVDELILVPFANFLKDNYAQRKADIIARRSGDEFFLALPNTTKTDTETHFQNFESELTAFFKRHFEEKGLSEILDNIYLNVSYGIADSSELEEITSKELRELASERAKEEKAARGDIGKKYRE